MPKWLPALFGKGPARRRLELTVADQWVLKCLFSGRERFVAEEDVVAWVQVERPSILPHEVPGSLRKLVLTGALDRDDMGRYRVAGRARRLKSVLPERPGVNIDYYG